MQSLGRPRQVEVEHVTVTLDEDAVGVGDSYLVFLGGGRAEVGGVELCTWPFGAPDLLALAVDTELEEFKGLAVGCIDAARWVDVPRCVDRGVAQQLAVLVAVGHA